MFDSLQSRLGGVFDKLRGRGALSESDVDEALGEVRNALIEADVALPVVRTFIDKVLFAPLTLISPFWIEIETPFGISIALRPMRDMTHQTSQRTSPPTPF